MENLLPPLLILLAVAVVIILVIRAGSRRSKASLEGALAAGPEAAAAAAARLTEAQHRTVYSLIARGLTVQAIAAYREATGAGLVEARNAVILMDRHPQQFRGGSTRTASPEETESPAEGNAAPSPEVTAAPEPPRAVVRPRPAHHEEGQGEAGVTSAPAAGTQRQPAPSPGQNTPNVPADPYRDEPRPQVFPYRYRAIVSNGHETLEVASNMLNDAIYNEIKALAQIGDAEDAAQMLRRHSDITIEDARAFVALL